MASSTDTTVLLSGCVADAKADIGSTTSEGATTTNVEKQISSACDHDAVSHNEIMALVRGNIQRILEGDPLLKDLHIQTTLEEVKSQIALEYGQAITVNVRRADDEVLPIVVVHYCSVQDLKAAIKRHVMLRQHRAGGTTYISWRYVWKKYWLCFQGTKLTNDRKSIKEYGISNRSEVTFLKRLKHQNITTEDS